MADLGSIGVYGGFPGYIKGTVIAGQVLDHNGAPCARAVYLLNRPASASESLVERQRTFSNVNTGVYAFPVASAALPGYVASNVVICFDDEAGEQYNALIFDKVAPA